MFHRARIPAPANAASVMMKNAGCDNGSSDRTDVSDAADGTLRVASKTTGLPSHAAAMIEMRSSGRFAAAPSHAATRSWAMGGRHCVSRDANVRSSRPASENAEAQSTARGVARSRGPGTAVNRSSLPAGSNVTSAMPGTSAGGSRYWMTPNVFSGTSNLGLWRYTKNNPLRLGTRLGASYRADLLRAISSYGCGVTNQYALATGSSV